MASISISELLSVVCCAETGISPSTPSAVMVTVASPKVAPRPRYCTATRHCGKVSSQIRSLIVSLRGLACTGSAAAAAESAAGSAGASWAKSAVGTAIFISTSAAINSRRNLWGYMELLLTCTSQGQIYKHVRFINTDGEEHGCFSIFSHPCSSLSVSTSFLLVGQKFWLAVCQRDKFGMQIRTDLRGFSFISRFKSAVIRVQFLLLCFSPASC